MSTRRAAAFTATVLAREDASSAPFRWRQIADQLGAKGPGLAVFMDESEHDVPACLAFPGAHRPELHSTNPLERLHGEIRRRTGLVGMVPNQETITRPIGAILLEHNDESAVQSTRYMTLEPIASVREPDPMSCPMRHIERTGPAFRILSRTSTFCTTRWDTIRWSTAG